jgi:hypothetical protein
MFTIMMASPVYSFDLSPNSLPTKPSVVGRFPMIFRVHHDSVR